ncbi:MAG TPA: hypothetical protein VF897_13660, partial [Roseiflexaceae bacterium]
EPEPQAGAPDTPPADDLAPLAAPAPAGLELLARMRNALEDSAEYLQEQSGDQARQLAQELAALQAALPDLSVPRLPFARLVAATR